MQGKTAAERGSGRDVQPSAQRALQRCKKTAPGWAGGRGRAGGRRLDAYVASQPLAFTNFTQCNPKLQLSLSAILSHEACHSLMPRNSAFARQIIGAPPCSRAGTLFDRGVHGDYRCPGGRRPLTRCLDGKDIASLESGLRPVFESRYIQSFQLAVYRLLRNVRTIHCAAHADWKLATSPGLHVNVAGRVLAPIRQRS